MAEREIVRWVNGQLERWLPATLDKLGKDEKFLEDVLAACPELMGLASRRSGIRGPFKIFTQLGLRTPSGRSITLDIVALASSGHVVVVEVKRSSNPELRDRAVIAQIIDYASSFAALTEEQVASLFGSAQQIPQTWGEIVQNHFPNDDSCDELAEWLLKRMQNGELNLVIACDRIPPGLPEVVAGIAAQNAFGFDLELVEVIPYVRETSPTAEIIFVPSVRLSTEIVARTAVTVTYQQGDSRPATQVRITSMEDVEENVRDLKRRQNPNSRTWTDEEVEEHFRSIGDQSALAMFEFTKRFSVDEKFAPDGEKQTPSLGFHVKGLKKDGSIARFVLFQHSAGSDKINVYLNRCEEYSAAADYSEFKRRMNLIFANALNTSKKELYLPIKTATDNLSEFSAAMQWFRARIESRLVS